MPVITDVGSVRFSLEHLKVMAFVLKRQTDEIERQLGISIPVAFPLLNSLHISPEDWQAFWQKKG